MVSEVIWSFLKPKGVPRSNESNNASLTGLGSVALDSRRLHCRLLKRSQDQRDLKQVLVMLTSYKTSFNSLQSKIYLYPAEEVSVVDSKPVRQFHLVASAAEERDKRVSGLESYKAQGMFSDGVWVTPGLPHLVFLTA